MNAWTLIGSLLGCSILAGGAGLIRRRCGATNSGSAGFLVERSGLGRTEWRWPVLRVHAGPSATRDPGSGASFRAQWRRQAADLSDLRSQQSEPQAVGEGAHEKGQ